MIVRRIVLLAVVAVTAFGCSTAKQVIGVPSADPSVAIKSAETKWLLIRNPRFGDVPSEPEYVWVEEDKTPVTLSTVVFGKGSIIAPPEIVARYGAPPGGGKISARQGMPAQTPAATPAPAAAAPAPAAKGTAPAGAAQAQPTNGKAPEGPKHGFVVYVDTTRIVIDLTAADGIRPGALVSLRRADVIPLVHPVTGEVLGNLDEEIGTARVTEMRERFSVADVQTVAPGARIQVKDRVVPK